MTWHRLVAVDYKQPQAAVCTQQSDLTRISEELAKSSNCSLNRVKYSATVPPGLSGESRETLLVCSTPLPLIASSTSAVLNTACGAWLQAAGRFRTVCCVSIIQLAFFTFYITSHFQEAEVCSSAPGWSSSKPVLDSARPQHLGTSSWELLPTPPLKDPAHSVRGISGYDSTLGTRLSLVCALAQLCCHTWFRWRVS